MQEAIGENNVSRARHDLRTVVNHLEGYVLLLRDEELDWIRSPEVAEALEQISETGREILRVLEVPGGRSGSRLPSQILAHIRTHLEQPALSIESALVTLGNAEPTGDHRDVRRLQQAGGRLRNFIATGYVSDEVRPAPPVATTPGGSTARILIIEDDDGNRELLERMLRRFGYEVTGASSGADGLRVAAAGQFDVVLLDLILPDIEGHALLGRLRATTPLVPIIVISALNDVDNIVRCIDEGAEDYFAKPFIPALLRTRVASALDRKRYRELLAQAAAHHVS